MRLSNAVRPSGMLLAAACWLAMGARPATPQELIANPDALFFSWLAAQPPAPQTVTVTTTASQPVTFAIRPGAAAWLRVDAAAGITPQSFKVSVNPAGLAPGIYSDSIAITAGESVREIPVRLVVPRTTHLLIVSPPELSFEGESKGVKPMTRLVSVASAIGARTPFTVSLLGGERWLSASPASGTAPAPVEVTVDYYLLQPGVYSALVNVVDPDGYVACSVRVSLRIGPSSPVQLSPSDLYFTAAAGTSVFQTEEVSLVSAVDEEVEFFVTPSTSSGGNWLAVDPLFGATAGLAANLVVTVNPEGLAAGTYRGALRISVLWQTVELPVTLEVTSGPVLVVSPDSLWFVAYGHGLPEPAEIEVDSGDGEETPFQVATRDGDWLDIAPLSGVTPATLKVAVKPNSFSNGVYRGALAVSAPGSSASAEVSIALEVTDRPPIDISPSEIEFVAGAGDGAPVSRELSVASAVGSPRFEATAAPATWLSVAPSSGMAPAKLTVTADPSGLPEGRYSGVVAIASPNLAGGPISIPITLTVANRPEIAAVVHAASGRAGLFAAGTAVSIYGSHLGPRQPAAMTMGPDGVAGTLLEGVRVLFDEFPAPLLYVSQTQLCAVTPYHVLDRSWAQVVVESGGVRSKPAAIQLFDAAPGIFTADASGSGPAAALNQDGTVNSAAAPAARGSIVSVYATGAGAMNPALEDGAITRVPAAVPRLPVRAWVGGHDAEVLYAGGAPGLIAGILQINVRVPPGAPSGLPALLIAIGNMTAQPGVAIAVR